MELFFKSEKAQNRIQELRTFLLSDRWIAVLFCLAGIIATASSYMPEAKIEITGTIFFAYIIGFTMVISGDLMTSLIPFMFTYLIAIRCYDSFDDFMQYKWWAIPLIPMVLFYVIAYWKPLTTKGSQFKPMVFVSASIILGGIGFISPEIGRAHV